MDSVGVVLGTASLIDITRGDLLTAAARPGQLPSHDALHFAVAPSVGADEILASDAELAAAAATAGLIVTQPR